jgi:hypothetical protein
MSVASERGTSNRRTSRSRSSSNSSGGSGGSRASSGGSGGSRASSGGSGGSRAASRGRQSSSSGQKSSSSRQTRNDSAKQARNQSQKSSQARSRAQASKRSQSSDRQQSEPQSQNGGGGKGTISNIVIPVATATIGVAGGVLLGRNARSRNRKVLGIPVPIKVDFGDMTQQIGQAGKQLGKLAREVQAVREKAEQIGRAVT